MSALGDRFFNDIIKFQVVNTIVQLQDLLLLAEELFSFCFFSLRGFLFFQGGIKIFLRSFSYFNFVMKFFILQEKICDQS